MKGKNILRFGLIFLLAYILLLAAYTVPSVRKTHVALFNGTIQFCFNLFHPDIRTDFRTFEVNDFAVQASDQEKYDFSIYIYDKIGWQSIAGANRPNPRFILNQNGNLSTIGPMLLFFALLLASPLSWKHKLRAFAVGVIVLSILLAMKFSFLIGTNAPQMIQSKISLWLFLSKIVGNGLRTHEGMLLMSTGLWMAICLGKKEIQWFRE